MNILKGLYELLPYKIVQLRRENYYNSFLKWCSINRNNECVDVDNNESTKVIWLFWYQGFDNAPRLVKQCVDSIYRYAGEYQVILLDKSNYNNYVSIEEKIVYKMLNGKLSMAHFSDILRLSLLYAYGGVWIDSTVLLTSTIPKEILEADIFVFKGSWIEALNLEERGSLSNWFIVSKKNNPIIKETLDLMVKYINTKRKLCSYYLCHWIMTYEFRIYRDAWETMPIYPNVNPHIMQFCEINKPFSVEQFETIKRKSFCHKLSYKLDVIEGTLLEAIVEGRYEE